MNSNSLPQKHLFQVLAGRDLLLTPSDGEYNAAMLPDTINHSTNETSNNKLEIHGIITADGNLTTWSVAPEAHQYKPKKLRPMTGRIPSQHRNDWQSTPLPEITHSPDTQVPVAVASRSRKALLVLAAIFIVGALIIGAVIAAVVLTKRGTGDALTSVSPEITTYQPEVWSAWTDHCSLCGYGYKIRVCSVCSAVSVQITQCELTSCTHSGTPGSWSSWLSWSICSHTCGGGSHTRTRTCVKRNSTMHECIGTASQARKCSDYPCPDCSMTCKVGTVSADCTHCKCSTVISAQIMSSLGNPLKDVVISPLNAPYVSLFTTSMSGQLTITGQCSDNQFLFSHPGYVSAAVKAALLVGTKSFIMEKVDPLTVITSPVDAVRLSGESVTLCCETTGNPVADNYEWFKDGNLISTTNGGVSSNTEIINVSVNSSGYYSCRANNDYSAVISKSALINVKESSGDFCATSPQSKLITLPEGCTYQGNGTIDEGQCGSDICTTGTTSTSSCFEESNYCCGPISHESVAVLCEQNFKLSVLLVKSCGCILCPKPTLSISGLATGTDGSFLNKGDIIKNGTVIGQTSENGTFEFQIPYETGRIVLLFRDTLFQHLFDSIFVINVPKGRDGMQYILVKMLTKANQFNITSSVNNSIPIAGTNTTFSPFAHIIIPANSFYSENGQPYVGSVKVSLGVIDPSDISTFDVAPGDFTVIDEEGIEQPLESYGMFSFEFVDPNGERLSIPGDTTLEIPAGKVDSSGITGVKLWRLNPTTGRWQFESNIATKQDRKKSHSGSQTTLHGIPYTMQWFNFDSIRNSACYSKVRVFKSREFHSNEQVEGMRISVIIQGSSNSLSRFRAYTDNGDGNGYCVLHPCQSPRDTSNINYGYKGYIFAERFGKPLIPASGYQTGLAGNLATQLSYAVDSTKISVKRVDLRITPNGPYYDYTGSSRKGWAYSSTCSNAPITDSHFRFSADYCYKWKDFVQYDQVIGVACLDRYYMLWNSILSHEIASKEYSSTFIKIYTPGIYYAKLRAYSMVKNKRTKSNIGGVGSVFGYREDCIEENAEVVCLEVKSPTDISCGLHPTDIAKEMETVVRVTIMQGYGTFNFSEINAKLVSLYSSDIIQGVGRDEFSMVLKRGPYGPDFGIYTISRSDRNIARLTAKRNCLSGNHIASNTIQATTDGWVLKVNGACSDKLDLVFILDTSGSMSGFTSQIRSFIQGVMMEFSTGIANGEVKIALVSYKLTNAIAWKLDDPITTSISQMTSRVASISLSGIYEQPHIALNLARTEVFSNPGDRSDAKNGVIYITDGNESQNKLDVEIPEMQKIARIWAAATSNAIASHIDLFETYPGDEFGLGDTKMVASAIKNYLC